jgi:leucyl/phenylalanyl-tRNA--protein transferase
MHIPWLIDDPSLFPDVHTALKEPNGLLAAGGDLSTTRLLNAYKRGIFPWYNRDEVESGFSDSSLCSDPILWWCPNPRSVLYLNRLKVSRSLRKSMRKSGYSISFDRDFKSVITHCDVSRMQSSGTWIHPEMIDAYTNLARLGFAHSVECWLDDTLVGGLYGVQIGGMFFGESMFSLKTDSSKVCLVYLCAYLKQQGAELIDCQIQNPHLQSLGAEEISLDMFLAKLENACSKQLSHDWPTEKQNPYSIYSAVYLDQ